MNNQYEIEFRNSVNKDLKKISPHIITIIFSAIEELAHNPYPSGVAKLTDTESYYRIRIGDYRVIYEISKNEHKIIISYIRHRKTAYNI
ncbi:type II toxin-antitoxin system RelE/ParE family toxin [Methanospirillum hungatei]|uniref:type II toxin-antitoxin system RelE family toxin n=1 Tax=Methanospirillum hungatei TaxID=2203 RepID=UPI002A1AFEB4|nr:type II toxin-antitoxin system RelE/ParE family toxin [Methanospirillum hungatei]